jgi:hypothetical protein
LHSEAQEVVAFEEVLAVEYAAGVVSHVDADEAVDSAGVTVSYVSTWSYRNRPRSTHPPMRTALGASFMVCVRSRATSARVDCSLDGRRYLIGAEWSAKLF